MPHLMRCLLTLEYGRTKCCHLVKAHKFSLMIYNYMDISSSLILIFFFSFLMRFLMNFVQICTRSRVGFELW